MKIGENLNYTVGRLRYSSDTGANPTASDTSEISTTTIAILCVIAAVMAFIILSIIVIICVVKKKSKKKQSIAFTGNTDVNMYASPAYGTHQVFTEPGLDHLYEPIDDFREEITTTLQDTTSPADDDKIDTEGYLKMNPSCEVIDQAATEGNECDTGSHSGSSEEYIHAADDEDHISANGNDEDDGYENDNQQKNDCLQMKADHEDTLM